MKISCPQEVLAAALSAVSHALPSRTTLPILEGVLMTTDDHGLVIAASDLQKAIEVRVPAMVAQPGTVLLPGKLLIEVVRKFPSGDVDIETGDKTAKLFCSQAKASMHILDAAEYPALPLFDAQEKVSLLQGDLRSMISQTAYAVSLDESRMILTGALLEMEEKQTRMVALDGYRLAMNQMEIEGQAEPMSVVVPGTAWTEISRLMTTPEEPVFLSLSPTHLMVEVDNVRIAARLLDGEFIKYRQIIPGEWLTRTRFSKRALQEAVDRCATMAKDGRSNLITLAIGGKSIVASAEGEFGAAEESIDATTEGKDMDIAFNVRYLADALKAIDDEQLFMCFNTPVTPAVLKPLAGDGFLHLVLPVRTFPRTREE